MAAQGQPRLTDPLRQCAVAPVAVPRSGERAITLLDLAIQSAGLPREIGHLPANAILLT
jgi:hypothetical protein